MIGYRGITYDEFLGELLNNIILENDFRKYKTFLFLQIATNVQRQNTLLRLPQNKEDSYTALLLGTKFFEVQSFFFRKLPLRIKYDDIKNHEITFGQSGSGKSTYISLKVYQIQKYFPKTSVICLDGGGDLSKLMMRFDLNKDSNRMVFISQVSIVLILRFTIRFKSNFRIGMILMSQLNFLPKSSLIW